MRKIIIAKLILVVFVFISVFNHNNHVKAYYDDELNQKNIYDWTDVLNDYSNHKNKVYTGPYYKIGLIGKHDQVHIGDDITLEFRLVDNYIGSNKMTSQIKNMNQVQFESRTLTNNVGITTSTTIGQTSVAELGLSYNETDKANISQESNFSSTFTFQNIYTSSKMSSVSMSYDYDVSVIPDNKPIFTYGKVAVFVKYKILKSCRIEDLWFRGWGDEESTIRNDYYAYKYLFEVDTFVYPDETFGDSKTGIFKLGSFELR